MKSILKVLVVFCLFSLLTAGSCEDQPNNTSALTEQHHTEQNQQNLNKLQPAPTINYSLERENLIKRFQLQNDRSLMFYMYIFVPGIADPIGYYQVNKVSSVNSQLTNTQQLVEDPSYNRAGSIPMPSPAEDGSYGTNGDAVFGFTPEDIYIEHNMLYVVSTVPLNFQKAVNRLNVISVSSQEQLTTLMSKIKK
jgi:hypothetical protein